MFTLVQNPFSPSDQPVMLEFQQQAFEARMGGFPLQSPDFSRTSMQMVTEFPAENNFMEILNVYHIFVYNISDFQKDSKVY